MNKNKSKQSVLDAASTLFYQKGFHATSVRDIANKASVNVSLISYYFNSKQGLLEYAVTNYYEQYMQMIITSLEQTKKLKPLDQLKELIFSIIHYKQANHQLSCFIHRELSVDSIFVREMSVTYVAKENYYLKHLFTLVLKESRKKQIQKEYLFLQLKGMIVTPFLLQNEFKHTILGNDSSETFVDVYTKSIHEWIEFMI